MPRTRCSAATLLLGFAGPLSPAQVALLRCEPVVRYIEHDSIAELAGNS